MLYLTCFRFIVSTFIKRALEGIFLKSFLQNDFLKKVVLGGTTFEVLNKRVLRNVGV